MRAPMKKEEYWKEGMDEKRFVLRIKSKLWILLAAALAGALFGGGVYLVVRQITKGEDQYRAEVLYSIVYDIQEEDETLKEFINEYNAYTWGDMMKSDRVIGDVLKELPDVDRTVIEASVGTDIASDPEFLSACFTTGEADLSNRIAAAYNNAMAAFGASMQGRGLTGIEVWKVTPACLVKPENKAANAACLGAVLGFLAAVLILCGWYVLDDSIVLESDFRKKYPYPVLGYRTRQADPAFGRPLADNLDYLAKKGAFREVPLADLVKERIDYAALREAPVVLLVEWGTPCLRLLDHVMQTLALQDVELTGIIITEADSRFLRQYYGKGLDN